MVTTQSTTLRDMYTLTDDSFTGGGGFADGSYIYAYGRENNIVQRRDMAYYINLVKPILNAQTDPVFVDEPQRIYTENAILDGFIENADNNNTSLTEMVHHATTYTNLMGNSFIIMDNFDEDELPADLQAVVDERKYPFIYSKETYDVFEYETNVFGTLQSISFFYSKYTPDNSDHEVYLYKRFSPAEIEYFYIDQIKDDDSGLMVDTRFTVTKTNHNLGVVPVVYYNKDILPVPPTYYSMASIARAIYNSSSEIQDLQRSQSFSILLIPTTSTGEESADNIVVSNHNALFYDSEASNAPEYISPDSNIMKTNQETLDKQINLLIQQADVLGSSAVVGGSDASSGIALSYKFFGKQQKLKESATIADYYDSKVIELLGLFLDSAFDYDVKYQDSFAPTFVENKEKITSLEQVANMNISDTTTATVNADIVKIVADVMGWDEKQLDNALESIVEVQETINEDEEVVEDE